MTVEEIRRELLRKYDEKHPEHLQQLRNKWKRFLDERYGEDDNEEESEEE